LAEKCPSMRVRPSGSLCKMADLVSPPCRLFI
jgi:hypothetical protein